MASMNKVTMGMAYFNMTKGEKIPSTHREMQLGDEFFAVRPSALAVGTLLRDIIDVNIQVKHLETTSGEVVVYAPDDLVQELSRQDGVADRLAEIFQGVIPKDSIVEVRNLSELGGRNYDGNEYRYETKAQKADEGIAIEVLLGDSRVAAVLNMIEDNSGRRKSVQPKPEPKPTPLNSVLETPKSKPIVAKGTDDEVAIRTTSWKDAEEQLAKRPGWIKLRLGQAGRGLVQPSLAGLTRAIGLYNPQARVVQRGNCIAIVMPEGHDAGSTCHAFGFFKTLFEGQGEIECVMFVNATDYVESVTVSTDEPVAKPKRVSKPKPKKELVYA